MPFDSPLRPDIIHHIIACYQRLGLFSALSDEQWDALARIQALPADAINHLLLVIREGYYYHDDEAFSLQFTPHDGFTCPFEQLIFELAIHSRWFFEPDKASICYTAADRTLQFTQDNILYQQPLFGNGDAYRAIAAIINEALRARFRASPRYYVIEFDEGGSIGFILLTDEQHTYLVTHNLIEFYDY